MTAATIITLFVGGFLLAAGLGVFGTLSFLRRKPLPPGYRTATTRQKYGYSKYPGIVAGEEWKITPMLDNHLLSDGYEISSYGYKGAVRRARRDIFAHYRNNVDGQNP